MLLNLFLVLPIISALAAYLMREKGAKLFSCFVALTQFLIGLNLTCNSDDPSRLFYFSEWIPEFGLNWSLGIDGGNVLLVLLTPLITLLALMVVKKETPNLSSYVASLLLLNGFLSGLFLAQNLGLFYIFFEAMLLPVLILVAGWSHTDGPKTALRFLLFTLLGSLPMLLGVLVLAFSGVGGGSLEFSQLGNISEDRQLYLFFPFLLAFLVKMPIVPFHGWLPTLYRNAPAPVVVVVAAVMSKAGTYGLLKIGLTVFPEALREMSGLLAILAVSTILYGAFAALGATSIRDVLAYSSLSHIAMICFGITSLTLVGTSGAGLQMAGHAVATGGMFLLVSLMENRGLPDKLRRYGGLAKEAPKLAALALFLVLASLGQPGLGSFPGELMVLTGTWKFHSFLTILAGLGIVFAAAYLLRWYQTIFTGELGTYRVPNDLTGEETALLCVPIALSLMIGFAPAVFLTPLQAWLEGVM